MSNDKKQLKVKQSGIMNIRGKEVATYPALIDYAHQGGMQSLEVAMLQYPTEANNMRAICAAKLVKPTGEVFTDIGDASPDNVPKGCVDSFVRIASTRAKSRVISDAFNIRTAMEGEQGGPERALPSPVIDAEYVYGAPEPQPQDKNAFAGGGENPISAKQAGFINSRAGKIGVDPQQRSRDMFGKPIESLFGWEADKVIKSLKSQ